jgi:hypothetical protein
MPLSPLTDYRDDHDDEGKGRRDATRGGGGTTRDEGGRWTAQGKRVESNEVAMRCRWTVTEVMGEEGRIAINILAIKSYSYLFSSKVPFYH